MGEAFAAMLREHRLRLRLTQEALAERAVVSSRSIREMERGRGRSPRLDTTTRLADALELSGSARADFVQAGQTLFWESRMGGPGRAGQTEPGGRHTPASVAEPASVIPRQLPADIAFFTGRDRCLARLDALLPGPDGDQPAAVVIAAVSGTAGVGKTALVVHWAHRAAHRFPDGQLYLNLRGFDHSGLVMTPAEALRALLDALDVPPDRIPPGLAAQSALYRSLVAGKRMLVVLDNARDAEHVRPLIPASAMSMVVVNSRNRLTGLVATDGARALDLDVLSNAEATELVNRRLHAHQVAADAEFIEKIVNACARLPIALAVATSRAQQSRFSLAAIAAELDKSGQRLDALDTGDVASQVRSVFSWSFTALTPAAARLFRLLGLHPGPDLSTVAAASLAGCELRDARAMLADLVRANLLTECAPGRYTFHDLLREYAADLARHDDSADSRCAARLRLFDHYTHTAHRGERLLNPQRDPMPWGLAPLAAGSHADDLADPREATAWLTAERPVLLGLLRASVDVGFDAHHTWQLAWALDTFLTWHASWHDLTVVWEIALDAAHRIRDDTAAAHAHRGLAHAATRLGHHSDAHAHLNRASELFAATGDQVGEARVYRTLSVVYERQGDPGRAIHHAEQALALFRAAGHRRGQAVALNSIGWCRCLLGEYAQAVVACKAALVLLQEVDDRHHRAATLDSLGYAYHHLRRYPRAIECYQKAMALYREIGDHADGADTLHHLGDTQHAVGDSVAARANWQQALDIFTEIDHQDAEAVRNKLDRL